MTMLHFFWRGKSLDFQAFTVSASVSSFNIRGHSVSSSWRTLRLIFSVSSSQRVPVFSVFSNKLQQTLLRPSRVLHVQRALLTICICYETRTVMFRGRFGGWSTKLVCVATAEMRQQQMNEAHLLLCSFSFMPLSYLGAVGPACVLRIC